MIAQILSVWKCPTCSAGGGKIRERLEEGEALVCTNCSSSYPVENGIIHTNPTLSKGMADEIVDAREKTDPESGLVFPLNEHVDVNDEWLRSLPMPNYHAGAWDPSHDVAYAMEAIDLQPDQWVLDLGAGVCWTTRDLARVSRNVVAVDILDDKYLGLASGVVYMQQTGNDFHRVNALMEDLPFRDHAFDVVLTNCSAHHAENLPQLIQEIKRVLKPEGTYILSNELTQGMLKKSELIGNDHYYTIKDYVDAIRSSGFDPQLHFPRSIHHVLTSGSLQRKSGKWKNVGRLASLLYKNSMFQKLIHRQTYVLSRLFGVPPVIISRIQR